MTIIFKDNAGRVIFTGTEKSTEVELAKAFRDATEADKACPLCECGKPGGNICPDCGARVCGDHAHGYDPNQISRKYISVMGRRGWRRLGEYDS